MLNKKQEAELLNQLLELSNALLKGDYSKRITIDAGDNKLVQLVGNLNRLADLLLINSSSEYSAEYKNIESFMDVLSSYATNDFSKKLEVSSKNTVIDAIATGINILGEELEQTTKARDYYSSEYSNVSELLMVNEKLSAREKEIMLLIVKGQTNIKIANRLHISKRTVEGHRKNILKKLKMETTAALINYAITKGLVK